MLLGNDVVDRRENGAAEKHVNSRFLGRVFISEERDCIRTAQDPSLALWMIWAAKESVFKVARKLNPHLVFSHREIFLDSGSLRLIKDLSPAEKGTSSSLVYKDLSFAVRWKWSEEYVHCVAGWKKMGALGLGELESLTALRIETLGKKCEGTLSARELESAHSEESREVRLLAKTMLSEHYDLTNPELVRQKFLQRYLHPEVLENGVPARGIDLSLSHDGRFIAAVITLRRE